MKNSIGDVNAAFGPGDVVVYPGHGVGKVTSIETQRIGQHDVRLFVINFEHDRMTLRLPLHKAGTSGLRGISSQRAMERALATFKVPASRRRAMWSRRAVEYTTKINSGDLTSIAEVVRDLHRPVGKPDQSYSERQFYEQAMTRLVHEVAAVDRIEVDDASTRVKLLLEAA